MFKGGNKAFIVFALFTLVACSMPTDQQKNPMQLGTYLAPADSKGIRKKARVEPGRIMYYAKATNTRADLTYNYRKIDKVVMDFTYTYSKYKDGTPINPKLTKHYQTQLKAYPIGAASFYEVTYKTSGLFGKTFTELIIVSYAKGLVETLMIKQAGSQVANSFIENDKYEEPEGGVFGLLPANPSNVVFTFNDDEKDQLKGGFGGHGGILPGADWTLENQPFEITRIPWLKES